MRTKGRVTCLILVVLLAGIFAAERAASQESGNAQSSASEGSNKEVSSEPSKQAASDLKPTASDEGQMATVSNAKIPANAKVYVAPMEGGFENYIIAGLRNKKVPLTVVVDRSKADYEISGVSESEKAGWAKMLFMGSQQSKEQASIKIADLKTGSVIFGYSVHKGNSYRGKQSAGEACAKHIKQIIAE